MSVQPLSRKIVTASALSLTCLLLAYSPSLAQDAGTTATPAPAVIQPEAATPSAPAAPTPDAAAPATPTPAAPAPATSSEAAPVATDTVPTPAASPAAEPTSPATAITPAESPAPATAAQPAPPSPTTSTSAPAAPVSEEDMGLVDRVLTPLLATEVRDPNLPHDLSPLGMYRAADIVVKAVMIGLAFASVVTWTVLIVKMFELWGASRSARNARRRIDEAPTLAAAVEATGNRRDPSSQMVRAAMAEVTRSAPAIIRAGDEGVKDRVGSLMNQIEAQASRDISRGTGLLATIGSTAPFVGLFGTVWGIMNSFISISESQTTNLAVVAPGIAEALLATAIGLVAAIPAVVIYNVFARAITGYRLRLANASAGVQRLVSRDLDFQTGA